MIRSNLNDMPAAAVIVTTRGKEMSAYDRLPERVRRAIDYARFKWSAEESLAMLADGVTEDELVDTIRLTERKIIAAGEAA